MPPDRQRDAIRTAVAAAPPVSVRAVLILLAAVVTVWLLYQLSSVLVLAFLALIVAAGALGPSRWLEERGLPRLAAVVLVYLAVIAVIALILVLIVPPLVGQLVDLASDLPVLARNLMEQYRPWLERLGFGPDASRLFDAVMGQVGGVANALASVPFAVVGFVVALVTVTFLSALFLLERTRAREWLMRFVAEEDRSTVLDLSEKAVQRLGAFTRGQLLIMTVTGVASAVGLMLLGVPFALPLGFLAFLTEAIPMVGPFIAGAVMVVVAFLESPGQAAATAVLVIAIQQLEGFVLIPVVQGRVISISPPVALLAILSGSALGGIAGALVAIPIVAIATVVIDDVVLPWRQRHMASSESDRPPEPDEDEAQPTEP